MILRALTFVISELESGACLGYAMIVPDARYCSTAWTGAERLERRSINAADWGLLLSALKLGLPSGPLPASHAVVRMLLPSLDRRARIVQYLSDQTVDGAPGRLAEHLDGLLRSMS